MGWIQPFYPAVKLVIFGGIVIVEGLQGSQAEGRSGSIRAVCWGGGGGRGMVTGMQKSELIFDSKNFLLKLWFTVHFQMKLKALVT